jgi:DNA (cytosine-5)-methyltransferase 1
VDLFCGAGGLSLGFRTAGCHIRAAVDCDAVAGETFRQNFEILQPDAPPVVHTGNEADLQRLDLDVVSGAEPPDIVIGGPPCQGFAVIGRAKLDSLSDHGFAGDPRNELYRVFVRAIRTWRPRAFLMENVPGMMSVEGRNVANEAAAELAEGDYEVGYAVLNAVWYGVPQYRRRLFIIGIRRECGVMPTVPLATHIGDMPLGYPSPSQFFQRQLGFVRYGEMFVDLSKARFSPVTARQALHDLPVLRLDEEGDRRTEQNLRSGRPYGSVEPSAYARLMRDWPGFPTSTEVIDHAVRRTPRDYETFERMLPGDRYPEALAIARDRLAQEISASRKLGRTFDIGALVRGIVPPYPAETFVDRWRKLIPDQPSWTLTAHLARDTYSHIHYDGRQRRMISIREAARLQSFPDAFRFGGAMNDCFGQIGNAVPPILAWALAVNVLETLRFRAYGIPWDDLMRDA